MNTAVARRPATQDMPSWRAVPIKDDAQLQTLLKAGWEIEQEGPREIRLKKHNGGETPREMTHKRKRAW